MCYFSFLLMALTVASINVRSLISPVRCLSIFDFLSNMEADVFFLQECWLPYMENYKTFEEKWSYGCSVWSGCNENKSGGIGILFKNKGIEIKNVKILVDGRALVVKIVYLEQEFLLINIYASPDKHERFQLLELISSELVLSGGVVMGGDFNCVLSGKDKGGGSEEIKLDKTSGLLNRIKKDFGLTDVFRHLHPNEPGFTWYNAKGTRKSRLDMVFTTKHLSCSECKLEPSFFSDHMILIAKINFDVTASKGPGVWKLNNKLLEDEELRNTFRVKYERWRTLKEMFESECEWWEWVKSEIKKFFVKVGRNKVQKEKRQEKSLQGKLQRLYRLGGMGLDVYKEINEIKLELKGFFKKKCEKIIFLSKVEHVEKNEKCTRFFFKKVVENNKVMTALKNQQGISRRKGEEMIGIAEGFYSDLYKERRINEEKLSMVLNKVEGGVSNSKKEELEKEITVEELDTAVKTFKKNKTPGGDGLGLEFYLGFWELLRIDLMGVFKEMYRKGEMPLSFRQGVIILLYKKGDREELKNWRPISLQCFDYKLLAKVITNRLSKVISSVIHADQVCAIPGRRVLDSLVLLRDSIGYCKERKNKLCILNLDLEKAYDRVVHKYMFAVLEKMGFPKGFVKWIRVMYTNIESRILINGMLSRPVTIQSGVRQGCPLSPLLFICSIEILGHLIRMDPLINGVKIPGSGGKENKCIMYMDDVTVACTNELSVEQVLKHTDSFCEISGSKLNMGKCECMVYGERESFPNIKICFKKDFIQILGIKFDSYGSGQKNWEELVGKVAKKIGFWGLRDLTLEGKVLIIKTMILPLVLYVAAIIPPPRMVLNCLIRQVMGFFWGSKCERLKRSVVYKEKVYGGKGVPDLTFLLWLKFVHTQIDLCLFKNNKASFFVKFYLGGILRKLGLYKTANNVPSAFEVPYCFSRIEWFFKEYDLIKTEVEQWRVYKKIKQFVQDKTVVCTVGQFPHDVAEGVWKDVAHPKLLNKHKDLAWQTAHGILPTRGTMYKRDLVRSPRCPRSRCGEEETAGHLFWDCAFAKEVWKESSKQLHLGKCILNKNLMLLGIRQEKIDKERWFLVWSAILCVREALWKARNMLICKGVVIGSREVVQLAEYYLCDYRRRKHSEDSTPRGTKRKMCS